MTKFAYVFLISVGLFSIFSFLYIDYKKSVGIEESLMLREKKDHQDDLCKNVNKKIKEKFK